MTARHHIALLVSITNILISLPFAYGTESWHPPEITLAPVRQHPAFACSPAELSRLQAAYRSKGPAHQVVTGMISSADRAIADPIKFPPRGGQHNQWYQCDKCQIALKRIDATHHRCPRCNTIYSGEPYDDVIFSHQHSRNLQHMVTAAWAYAITGDVKYAAFTRNVLIGYAQRYQTYPLHSASRSLRGWGLRSGGHLYEQTLTEAASFARTIAPAYDLIYDWTGLSDDDHQAIRTGLILPILKNTDRNHAGKSNWQTWHNAAFIWGGALLNDATWVRKAISDPSNGFAFQMSASVTDDGMWYENSWGYHFYTLGAIVEIVEVARHLNIDLWSHPSLRKMFTVAIDYAMPNGRFPRFGDDVNTSLRSMSGYLEYAYHAYNDSAMIPYLETHPTRTSIMFGRIPTTTRKAPRLTSKVLLGAGHAILRTDGPAKLAVAMTFGPYGGFHGHFDKLSFVWYAFDQELGYDPGRARSQAYRLPIHRQWYKATLGHNTVLVDQASQRPASGTLEFFAANDQYAVAVAHCAKAYADVRHRRMLCLTPSYLLVFDDLAADRERRFDWTYHNRAQSVQCDTDSKPADQLGDGYVGQKYIQHIKQAKSNGLVHVRFVDKNMTTHLTMARSPGTIVYTGDGVGNSISDRVPMTMITHYGKGTRFAAVLDPVERDHKYQTSTIQVAQAGNATRITVARGKERDVFTLELDNVCKITSNGDKVALDVLKPRRKRKN